MYCILTIARYPKWMGWAGLLSMALFRLPLSFSKQISFWKLLGCGKNGTFDIRPDWRQWGTLMTVDKLSTNYQPSTFISNYFKFFHCEICILLLEPIEGHGQWDGKKPFGELPNKSDHEGSIGVLTRATIRINKLSSFWKNVESVSSEMRAAKGLIVSVGIGEVPFIKQATFSIWQSKEHMKQFAYHMQQHAEVIKKTRKEKWYSEEMFVRFKIIASSGSLRGKKYF